jgi:hypothetical protein
MDFLRLGLALLFALLAAGGTALFYLNRDLLVEWKRVKPVGAFTSAEDPKLAAAALAFAQEKMARPGEDCVGQWVARDEKYLYMAVGCAKLKEEMGELTTSGDANFHPTRFRYDGDEIENWEQPDQQEYGNSMRRLFPKEAQDLLRLNQDLFIKLLKAKQQLPAAVPSATEPAVAPATPTEPATQAPVPHQEPVSSAL